MCRICGAYDKDNLNRVENINQVTEFQHRGGPDNRGIKTIDNVTFGHNRLSIIDLSSESDQPLFNHRYLLTYNGEIYNYREISPLSISDTQALFQTICNNGIEYTLQQLNGMFSIGIYDKEEQKIHLVVDRFAQKPLYYYHKGDKFYFASWPAALYDLEPSWEINKDALQSYWLLGSVMGDDSIFRGIKKLNAAEHLTYDIQTNTIKIERYWEPKFQDKTNDIEDLVLDAIRLTKVADVPVYVYLSGGIDSTLVASQHRDGLAVHLDGPERQYAERVAKDFDIDLKIVSPQTIETELYLTHYAKQCGEPSAAALIPYVTAKEVSKFAKVGIIGNGFDELTFGYNRTHQGYTDQHHIYRYEFMPEGSALMPFETHGKWYCGGRWEELMGFVQFDLNKTLDFSSMCHGLEMRSPALDHRLVEMMLSIDEKEHRKHGNKTLLKKILWKFGYDKQFTDRPKNGFSLYKQPTDMNILAEKSVNWCFKEGWIDCDFYKLNSRDKIYIEMACLSFFYWFKAFEYKIK